VYQDCIIRRTNFIPVIGVMPTLKLKTKRLQPGMEVSC